MAIRPGTIFPYLIRITPVLIEKGGDYKHRMFTKTVFQSVALLICSNIFMTFAWYSHLKNLREKPWLIAALLSWMIALAEYLLQVPANRIGFTQLSLGQLKIMQEVITLCVFAPFAVLYMHQPLKLNFLWAGLCMIGAVYFMFKS